MNQAFFLTRELRMGSAGDTPAPVGDPPTGTPERNVAKRPRPLAQTVSRVPSGESPDGTGGSPVLPEIDFSNTLLAHIFRTMRFLLRAALINTPLQRGGHGTGMMRNRFNGFGEVSKTVETVFCSAPTFSTPLKQGVNERSIRQVLLSCEIFRLASRS